MNVSEKNKAIELLKEMRESREWSENQGNGTRLTWMYKTPGDLVDKEEYLLGKAIDKSFNTDKNNDNTDLIGRSYEPSNVPKRLLAKPESTEQVDVAKKIHEDPLYAIKQKEMEARRKLLDNPVKLKEIKKMIMERNLQKHERKQKKKKLKKDAMKDGKSLDKLILKKLQILSENQRKKLLEEAAEVSDSSDSNRNKTKKKRLRSEDATESCDEKDSTDSSNDNKGWRKKGNDLSKKESHSLVHRAKPTQKSRICVETGKTNLKPFVKKKKEEINRDRGQKKNYRASRDRSSSSQSNFSTSSSDSSASSSTSNSSKFERGKKSKNMKMKSQTHSWKSSDRNERMGEYTSSKGAKWDNTKLKRHYSKSESTSNDSGDEIYQRQEYNQKVNYQPRTSNFTHKQESRNGRNYREKRQVSEKDKESKLKEMMENAKLRKQEREQNLADHRRIQTEEEKLKDFDDGFMRRQISHATSQGTVADRIRSNVNNIQRSKADMDRSFVRR